MGGGKKRSLCFSEKFLPTCLRKVFFTDRLGELEASVGNVSEVTVAELMGINTTADGERQSPVQQEGYHGEGVSQLPLATH